MQLSPAGDQGSQESADIDSDVEHGKSGIEPCAALGIEVRNDGAGIGLQQPHAEHDHDQADIKSPRARGHGQQRIAEGDGHAAREHGALRTDQPVRDPAAGQRCEIDPRGIQPVDRRGRLVVDAEAAVRDRGDQEKHQHGAHAVVGEPLPHFREEQRGEATRMPEKGGTQIRLRRFAQPAPLLLWPVPLFCL